MLRTAAGTPCQCPRTHPPAASHPGHPAVGLEVRARKGQLGTVSTEQVSRSCGENGHFLVVWAERGFQGPSPPWCLGCPAGSGAGSPLGHGGYEEDGSAVTDCPVGCLGLWEAHISSSSS